MLEKDPKMRITAEECLKHVYFKGFDPVSEKEIDIEDELFEDEHVTMFERMRKLNDE